MVFRTTFAVNLQITQIVWEANRANITIAVVLVAGRVLAVAQVVPAPPQVVVVRLVLQAARQVVPADVRVALVRVPVRVLAARVRVLPAVVVAVLAGVQQVAPVALALPTDLEMCAYGYFNEKPERPRWRYRGVYLNQPSQRLYR